jgi:hypothetical protein
MQAISRVAITAMEYFPVLDNFLSDRFCSPEYNIAAQAQIAVIMPGSKSAKSIRLWSSTASIPQIKAAELILWFVICD